MTEPTDHVNDILFGRWRSQTLYTGVELGVFDVVRDNPKHAVEIADQLDVDRERGYRLLRALGSLGLLQESSDRRFSVTPAGELLREDHPNSLRRLVLLEEGPTHYTVWKHLPDIVREGGPDGFQREFGHSIFDHQETDPEYAQAFNEGMTVDILPALKREDSSGAMQPVIALSERAGSLTPRWSPSRGDSVDPRVPARSCESVSRRGRSTRGA